MPFNFFLYYQLYKRFFIIIYIKDKLYVNCMIHPAKKLELGIYMNIRLPIIFVYYFAYKEPVNIFV